MSYFLGWSEHFPIGSKAYLDLTAEMTDILLRLEGCEGVICLEVYQGELDPLVK